MNVKINPEYCKGCDLCVVICPKGVYQEEEDPSELGLEMVANMVMIGALCSITGVLSLQSVEKAVLEIVPQGSAEVNRKALQQGYQLGQNLKGSS